MDSNSIKEKDLKQFGVVLGLILMVFAFFQWKHDRLTAMWILMVFSLLSEVLAAFAPMVLKPVCVNFLKVAKVLAWINTRIILILVFYLILIPIGLVAKLFGKDFLDRKCDKNATTYWKDRSDNFDKDHYLKQF